MKYALLVAPTLGWQPYTDKLMTLSQRQMSAMLVIAVMLHVAIVVGLSFPDPAPLPAPERPALRVNLLAAISKTSTNTPVEPVINTSTPTTQKNQNNLSQKSEKPTLRPFVPLVPQKKQLVAKSQPQRQSKPASISRTSLPAVPEPIALDATATARYDQLLVAWLEKHKKYPRRAKRLRIEGEGKLRILIKHDGQVEKASLEQSTGNRVLDKAALDMAKRANPFPAMPDNDPRTTLEFVVPVAFLLR